MSSVRLGIVGIGNMGSVHATQVLDGSVKRCELSAVCDLNPSKMTSYAEKIRKFTDSREMIRSGTIDAILIATPHYSHTTIGVDALENGLHVLVEKPISVHKNDCEKLIAAHKKNKKAVFAAMFNLRTVPLYKKIKKLVASGELGRIQRVSWTVTDWFRPESYYASGEWRATWAGEGGGVLLNQCPHNLDLIQWICGMPSKITAFCNIGKHHKIEVEDEVTAYLEYPDGAVGTFTTTTGEAPGVNRLEIAGDNGLLVSEDDKLRFRRNETPTRKFNDTEKSMFGKSSTWHCEIPLSGTAGQHKEIKQNFVNVILDGGDLIAPAEEGIKSVELANAMIYSSMLRETVDLPLNGNAYEKLLKKLIKGSKFVKKTADGNVSVDMASSYGR